MAYLSMLNIFSAWQVEREKLSNSETTKEEYDTWRYIYPKENTER